MNDNYKKIDGWLFDEEAHLLNTISKDKLCLELGSYCGKSSVVIADTALSLLCIDTFKGDNTTNPKDTYYEFIKNTKDYTNITHIISDTKSAVSKIKTKFDLIYIDADHSYEGVKSDYENYKDLLEDDGVLVFHDAYGENGEENNTPWEGVTRLVTELLNKDYKLVTKCRRIAVLKKV